ncbi:VIT1/CCC1 transporter family protein [Patescibacteria group bacterium]|nr:VIT1/CCC1 transporter family protein [Patescibacteria group bacterium]MCL5091532.1 VIT1/CCC1 transporter family protein [Patescibacteria group bacterium]
MITRVESARDAYLKRNLKKIKETHSARAIRRDIHHEEGHKRTFNLSDIILGGQDGLVNVLGIILGVAAATASNKIVIVAGLAAAFAESVSMAAVAYTTKLADADYYRSEYEREKYEIEHVPEGEREEIRALYESYGFSGKTLDDIVVTITKDKGIWLKVMMEQELKLEPVERRQALPVAVVVGVSAIIGSFIPLTPFFFFPTRLAMNSGLAISALTLFGLGYYKAKMTLGRHFLRQGAEMLIIGMVSALVGYVVGMILKV